MNDDKFSSIRWTDFTTTAPSLSRLGYFWRSLLLTLVSFLVVLPLSSLVPVLGSLLILVALAMQVCLMIQRLNDLERSAWFVLLGFVPLVDFFFGLYLLFYPGLAARGERVVIHTQVIEEKTKIE